MCLSSPMLSEEGGFPYPSLILCCQDRGLVHSTVSLAQGSMSIDERLVGSPPHPHHPTLPLLPFRLRGGLPPWCPYRAALHRGGQEAPAGGWTGEQCPAQGEGEEGFGTPCDFKMKFSGLGRRLKSYSTSCSCRGPKPGSQHLCGIADNHVSLQLPAI